MSLLCSYYQISLPNLIPVPEKCVFLCYPFGVKGYKLLDLISHKIFLSRDVSFQEHIFIPPSNTANAAPSNIFPTLPSQPPYTDPLWFNSFDLPSSPTPASNTSPPAPLRRFTRTRKQLAHLKDYLC